MIRTEEVTTALVVAKPTPSAPLLQRKPKKQLTSGITAPKQAPLIPAKIKSLNVTNARMPVRKAPLEYPSLISVTSIAQYKQAKLAIRLRISPPSMQAMKRGTTK